jgi:membrane protein involved in colicin uptake
MTPDEVRRLQAFAEANGTTMTINPDTGLPEAGMLSDLFKMVAPIALGAFLGPAGMGITFGGLSSAVSAGIATGGITALATGSLSRGLMAGLGAYGGAGLGESLMNAGTGGLAAADIGAQQLAGSFPTLAEGATQEQIAKYATDVGALRDTAVSNAGNAGFMERASAGLGAIANNPAPYAKDLFKYGSAAAAPIMADMMVPTTTSMPNIQGNDTINQFIYGPNGQYRRLNPVPAKNYGTPAFKPFNEGGIVALANGGAPGYANGMLVGDQDVFNYFKGLDQSKLGSGALDAQIAKDMQTYNVSAADIARITGTQGLQGDYEKRFVQQVAQPTVTAPQFLAQTSDVGLTDQALATALKNSNLSAAAQYAATHTLNDAAGIVGAPASAQNLYNAIGYTAGSLPGDTGGLAGLNANIKSVAGSLQNQIDAGKLTVQQAQNLSLAEMERIGINQADIKGATGKDFGNLFNTDAADKAARDKAAADAAAKLAADKAAADAAAKAAADKAAADAAAKAIADKAAADALAAEIAARKAAEKAAADALAKAIADGKTAAEAAAAAERARLEELARAKAIADKIAADAAAAANKITVGGTYVGTSGPAAVIGTQVGQGKITGVGSETTTGTTGPIIDYGGSSGFTTSPLTLAKQQLAEQAAATTAAQNAQLDLYRNWITLNPNATDTDHANFMDKLGLAPDVASRATPLSPQQMKNRYYDAKYNKMTGDSQAAYNFLMGKGANPTKSTVGQIARPYAEATLGYPGSGNQQYIFDPETRSYRLNKDYVAEYQDPTGGTNYLMSPNEIAAYFKANQGQADSATYDWAVENNLTPQEIAAATGVPLSTVAAKWRDAKAKKTAATKTEADKTAAAAGKTDTLDSSSTGGLAAGGIAGFAMGGMPMYAVGGGLGSLGSYSDGGRLLKGPGDGVSDSIPATIGNKQQPARLADGEFVIPARIVSELGNGSTEAGAKKLYAMMDRVQRARGKTTGKNKVAANSRADKYLPA